MKIFINTTSWAIVKQENETPILVGNNYVDQLKVYYDSNPSTQYFYPLLNILKPNDRKVGLISFDATSVEEPNPSAYTDDDNNTWYMFKFTLSSDNHQIDVSGKYQFTITTNYYNSTTGAILKQRNINTILSVVNAVTNDDNSVLILGNEPGEVIAELYALCQSLQTGVASLQISVSALTSNKADRDNTSQTIIAGIIKTNTLQGNGNGVLVDDEVSFNDITWFTDGDGTNKWKIFYNSDGNLKFTSVTPAKKVEIANVKVNEIHDGTGTSEIEMVLGGIQFIAKKWDNPSLYRQLNFYYENGLQIDEPTRSFNPTTKNYVDTKDALKLDKANVYNGLDKTAVGFALDARQGKALKDALDTLYNYVGYATGNDDDTTINKLREIFQFLAGEADDATLLSLLAGKQAKIDSDNKLDADLVDDTNATHKFVSASEKSQITTNQNDITAIKDGTSIDSFADVETALAAKQNVINNNNKLSSDLVDDATSANKFVSQQEKNQITANKNAIEEIEEAIPTKTSDLTNDSDFVDSNYVNGKIDDLKWELGANDLSLQTDTTVAYTKIVPTGAIGCQNNKLGFMSYKCNNLWNTTFNGNEYNVSATISGLKNNTNYIVKYWDNAVASNMTLTGATLTSASGYQTRNTFTFTTTDTTVVISLAGGSTSNKLNEKTNQRISLTEGDTAPTEFQPYFEGIRDSVVTSIKSYGANLIDNTKLFDYYIDVSGNEVSSQTDKTTDYIAVSSEQVTMSIMAKATNSGVAFRIAQYDNNKNFIQRDLVAKSMTINQVQSATFTLNSNCRYVRFMFNTYNYGDVNTWIGNIGSTAIPYKPYRGLIDTITIPSEIQSLTGYGRGINSSVYNVLDLNTKSYTQKVASYTFTGNETLTEYTRSSDSKKTYAVAINGRATTTNVLFESLSLSTATTMNTMEDNSYRGATDTTSVIFYSTSYQTSASMLAFLTGKTIYFELATPQETDISSYITDNTIQVEAGGYIVFENEFGQAVPSDITYLIEVAK